MGRRGREERDAVERGGLRCGSAGMVAQYQITRYHMITVSVKEKL